MTFAGAGRAEKMDDLVPRDEPELGEGQDAIAIERRLEREIEPGDRLYGGETAHAQCGLDAAVLAQGQLVGEQDVDRFQGADLALLEAAHDAVERLERTGHLQAD